MASTRQGVDAFIDRGYPEGFSFCSQYLSSPEFTVDFLKKFPVLRGSSLKTKEAYASDVARALTSKEINANEFLLEYVKKPRTWLSFKQGHYLNSLQLAPAENLLYSFGEPGWYGPILDPSDEAIWYIRTHKIEHITWTRSESGEKQFDLVHIRWPIIAKIHSAYVALSWEGFSSNSPDRGETRSQYPFWLSVTEAFKELSKHLKANWVHPELHNLLLHVLWDKYLNVSNYTWKHSRVRAEASGIALNAHGSNVTDIDFDVTGLKALSRELAESALESLGFKYPYEEQKIGQVENAILHTIVREWGTKSYEFTLERAVNECKFITQDTKRAEKFQEAEVEIVFRAHCYFGLNQISKTQDSLQHLKCYSECGRSVGVLKFLLSELEAMQPKPVQPLQPSNVPNYLQRSLGFSDP